MTVQELINLLEKVENKDLTIYAGSEETCLIFDISTIDIREFTAYIEIKKNKFCDLVHKFIEDANKLD